MINKITEELKNNTNKFHDLDNVILISTNEKGTIVDLYKFENKWYYQVELDNKTDDRDVIECKEEELKLDVK